MIALANDHAGLELKNEIVKLLHELNVSYKDFGTSNSERTDYPKYGYLAAQAVAGGECERGIIICGTGVGISLAANKVKGIRCAVCSDCFTAKLSREHNNANMLAIGARVVGGGLAKMIVTIWLETPFAGGVHQARLDQITKIEEGNISF
jgi:ribose 5-phosphate isomerase B